MCVSVSDCPQLYAPVPASDPPGEVAGRRGSGDRSREGAIQDVRLSRDRLHRRHRLPEPAGESPVC